ncbi:MAG: prolyl oligopeptidase family serine peptidase [Calditrichia bacterium]
MKPIGIILFVLVGILQPLFAQTPLTWEKMFSTHRISSPAISPDGKWIAYRVSTYETTENKSSSDIHLVSSDGKTHRRATTDSGAESSPQWSPDAKMLTFLSSRDGSSQVYGVSPAGGDAIQLTSVATGVDGYRWSPTQKHIAVVTSLSPGSTPETAAEQAAAKKKVNPSSGRLYDGLLYRHWNHWRDDTFSQLLVVSMEDGSSKRVTFPESDSPPISLGSARDFDWQPNGDQLAFVQNTDKVIATSTNNDVWMVGKDGSKPRRISKSKGNDNAPRFSPDGKAMAYFSMRRAGFESEQQDLFIYETSDGKHTNLTAKLDRYVNDAVWSPNSKKLYFTVPHHGRHRLYEVARKGGEPKLLLENRYISNLRMSPNGKFLVLLHQTSRSPYEVYRFDIKSRNLTPLTSHNEEALSNIDMNPIEDHWFTGAKGDKVHLMVIKPPGFEKGKRYPVINLIHGGPQGAWSDNFHYRWNSQMFAAPGYVVIMINFHGSRGYGQKFCDAVSKDWGGAPFEDIISGTRWAIANFDYIDADRIGAAGASYGGFMINWIEGHNPDGLFKTLVSHAGLFEQVSFYGATEELWFPTWEFGKPYWEDSSLYQKWNPANHVSNFNTPMLVIHGEKDFRVPYTQGLQLFTALQLQGVESKLLVFPDEDHFIRKSLNAEFWWRTVHEWFAGHLKN